MMPKVSVIVPNYNHAKFLTQRIESILNQTFQNFELLLLDDASTDDSLEILKTYKDHPKVSCFVINETNSGSPFLQWRRGIELAKGEYVWIAETDDFAEISFLEEAINVLENKNMSFVYTDSKIIKEEEVLGLWSAKKNNFFKTSRWSCNYENKGCDELLDYLLYRVTINNVSAVLFRKSSIDTHDFLNQLTQYKNVGDLFTYIHAALQGDVGYISFALNNYRDHTYNTTKTNRSNGILYKERIFCYLNTLDKLFLDKRGPDNLNEIEKVFKYFIRKNCFKLLSFNYKVELKLLIKKMIRYKVIGFVEGFYYIFLFKLYALDKFKSKRIIKSLIKIKAH